MKKCQSQVILLLLAAIERCSTMQANVRADGTLHMLHVAEKLEPGSDTAGDRAAAVAADGSIMPSLGEVSREMVSTSSTPRTGEVDELKASALIQRGGAAESSVKTETVTDSSSDSKGEAIRPALTAAELAGARSIESETHSEANIGQWVLLIVALGVLVELAIGGFLVSAWQGEKKNLLSTWQAALVSTRPEKKAPDAEGHACEKAEILVED